VEVAIKSQTRRLTPVGPPEATTIDDLEASESSFYKLAQSGKVPGQKVGKHWRFRRDTIDRWLDADGSSRPLKD
jgi:excisionase family DNA binding protein